MTESYKNEENKIDCNDFMDHLVITTACNDNCVTCVNYFEDRNCIHSYEGYKKKESLIKKSNHISVGGGEPTLHPDFNKIIKFVDDMNKEYTLLTNLRSFSNKTFFDSFQRLNLDTNRIRIATTLYGYDAKTHDSVTRSPGGFSQKITGLKNLLSNGYKIELRILVTKLNYKWLGEIANFILNEFGKEKGIERIAFMGMKVTGEAYNSRKFSLVSLTETLTTMLFAVDLLMENDYEIHILHYPHCVLPEKYWGNTRGVTAIDEQIYFDEKCKDCDERKNCSGLWKSYADTQGVDEINPIK